MKRSCADSELVEKMKNGFFVDNLANGAKAAESFELCLKPKGRRKEEGGFTLRKWRTNNTQLMERIQKAEVGKRTVEYHDRDVSYVP